MKLDLYQLMLRIYHESVLVACFVPLILGGIMYDSNFENDSGRQIGGYSASANRFRVIKKSDRYYKAQRNVYLKRIDVDSKIIIRIVQYWDIYHLHKQLKMVRYEINCEWFKSLPELYVEDKLD